jgi:bacterioferritin-associated ferredoxin
LLFLVAYQYMKAGASVRGVLDVVPFSGKIRALPGMISGGLTFAKGLYYTARLRAAGVPIHFGVTSMKVNEAQNGSVTSLDWCTSAGRQETTSCDSVAMGCGLRSETQIADLYDVKFSYDATRRQWLPQQDDFGRTSVDGIYLAGDGAGIAGADVAELTGRRAALAVLHDIGAQDVHREITRINTQIAKSEKFRRAMDIHAFALPGPITGSLPDDVMVCRCEGITAGDIRAAVSNFGIRDINRAKANCRVGMGRCQGRLCQDAAAEILAHAAGTTVEAVGRMRGQAPLKPVSLRSLAERALP